VRSPLAAPPAVQAFIGSMDGYANLFHGAIDELRVYDRSFTAVEITAVAAGVRPNDAEPLVICSMLSRSRSNRCDRRRRPSK